MAIPAGEGRTVNQIFFILSLVMLIAFFSVCLLFLYYVLSSERGQYQVIMKSEGEEPGRNSTNRQRAGRFRQRRPVVAIPKADVLSNHVGA